MNRTQNSPIYTIKKLGTLCLKVFRDNLVAEARLEHATSRLWAWRATNCSTPRYNQLISELRVQRYDFFPTPPNILPEICIYLTVIKQNSNKTYIKEAKTSKKQARLLFFRTIGPYGKRITFSKVSLPSRNISEYASYCNDYRHSMNGLRARYY